MIPGESDDKLHMVIRDRGISCHNVASLEREIYSLRNFTASDGEC